MKRLVQAAGLFFVLMSFGCATYQHKVGGARLAMSQGEHQKALSLLHPLADQENDDQLVYLLDYATALQVAGQYKKSTEYFLKADRLAESIDYHSVSRVAGSLALNEEMVQYKGDIFEKVFINAYLAMNFLEEGKLDEALVEARRINEKYLKYRADDKKSFELNPFSKYLSALVWEANRSYDDAYIAYQEAYKIDPSISTIQEDLIRSAKLARRMDSYKEWKKKFPEVLEKPEWYDRKKGELVVLVQQGWGPRKVPSRGEHRLPELIPTPSTTQFAALTVGENQIQHMSRRIYSVEGAAIATLKDQYGALVAKRAAGLATKAVLADQLRQKDEALGSLAWLAMNIVDRADLRQWSTLPESIQIIRVPLDPGTYNIQLQGLDFTGAPTGEGIESKEVQVRAGSKSFVIWRALK